MLIARGCEVLAKNWRTRWCEIDIVASYKDVIYFIEVKYRKNAIYGDGFACITPKKHKQMKFAADFWCAQNDWQGDYRMLAASVSGINFDEIKMVSL